MAYVRDVISNEIEKRILEGMIINTSFLRDVSKMIKPPYFQVDYFQRVSKWILDYYKTYRRAPGQDLELIFRAESVKLKEAEVEIIAAMLSELSDKQDDSFNKDSLFDHTIMFCKQASLSILVSNIQGHILQGKIDKAEELVRDFHKVARDTSEWVNPFDDAEVDATFVDDEEDQLFKLPGALGELIGYLRRGWLISFMGPTKRGKCITGDCQVFLANGTKMCIRDLVKSGRKERVVALNEETQRFESVMIDELFDNGVKDCFRVGTRTGRQACTTGNHEYLTPLGWKFLKDIKPGDFIAVPKRLSFFGDYDMKDCLVRFLAYILAEGGCTASQPTFTNADLSTNLDFERCCDELGVGYRTKGISHYLLTARPLLKKYHLLGDSAKTKQIPDEIMGASRKTISTFLKVFFTCDGSIFREKNALNIELTLANENLINHISHLLLRFGVVHIKTNNPATFEGRKFPAWRISIKSQEYVDLFLRDIGFESYKQTDGFAVDCKRSFLDKFPSQIAKRFYEELKKECGCRPHFGVYPKGEGFYSKMGKGRAKAISYHINKKKPISRESFDVLRDTKTFDKYMNSDILWDEVLAIDHIGMMDTYDISVPGHHNFVADDCILHNSFYAWETVFQGLTWRLKVAIFSLEMSKTDNKKRIYKRLTAMAEQGGEYAYPVFDCALNQDDSCQKIERMNKTGLLLANGAKPKYSPDMKYRPCDYCRHHKEDYDCYFPETWWATQKQDQDMSPGVIKKKTRGFKKIYGDNLRLIAPPSFSVGFDFIDTELDRLEDTEGFVPDIILVDSFDITEQEVADELQDENRKWMKGKRLAGVRHALVINCNQGNREADDKINIKRKHTGGTIKKLANVDVEYTLNQTDEEKKAGVMRVEVLVNRHDESTEKGQVFVLQQLKLGQPNLDSEWVENKKFRGRQ